MSWLHRPILLWLILSAVIPCVGGDVEAALEEAQEEEPGWTIASMLVCGSSLCCLCSAPAICCAIAGLANISELRNVDVQACPRAGSFTVVGDKASQILAMSPALLGDALLILLQPLVGIAVATAGAATTGWEEVPSSVQPVALLPLLTRMCLADATRAQKLDAEQGTSAAGIMALLLSDASGMAQGSFPPPFTTSKAEGLDATTDGMALVAVISQQLDPFCLARFTVGWSSMPLLAPAVLWLGLGGCMAATMVLASAVQYGTLFEGEGSQLAYARADLAGLGATAARIEAELNDDEAFASKFWVMLGRLFYECVFSLVLQGSAVMATGQGLGSQEVLALSMGFSAVMALKQVAEMAAFVPKFWSRDGGEAAVVGIVAAPLVPSPPFRAPWCCSAPSWSRGAWAASSWPSGANRGCGARAAGASSCPRISCPEDQWAL